MSPQVGFPEIRRPPISDGDGPPTGVGLCLSGGGYRAMLFHVGSLWRLNDAGYLRRLDRISSVSGGSIAAGVLACHWERLSFDSAGVAAGFEDGVVAPLRTFAGKLVPVDAQAVLLGALTPGRTVNGELARIYRALFGDTKLTDLPDRPEFVFDATSLQSGDLWRFSSCGEGDSRVGVRKAPDTRLTVVVAISSAFPPVLSPARLKFPAGALESAPGATQGEDDPVLQQPPYTTRVVLTDGGVYDNLGLEAVWSTNATVLISDAGGRMGNVAKPRSFWPSQILRIRAVADNQVRDLRKSQAVSSFLNGARTGAYWGIRSHVRDFGLHEPIATPSDDAVRALAEVPTRLARVPGDLQERLINWGYVICDTALRSHVDPSQPKGTLPYPDAELDPGK